MGAGGIGASTHHVLTVWWKRGQRAWAAVFRGQADHHRPLDSSGKSETPSAGWNAGLEGRMLGSPRHEKLSGNENVHQGRWMFFP